MPAFERPPSEIEPKSDATGRVVSKEMQTALVETKFTPLQSLITHIEGSRYVVTCYRQLVGASDQLKKQELNIDPQYQQYERISALEIRLQGDLSFSADEENKERTIEGEAITYPGIVFNFGDMLIGDAGDGRRAVFGIDTAVPLTWRKQTCYRIRFTLVDYLDKERQDDFDRKTVTKLTFVKSFVDYGKFPLVIDEVYRGYRELHRLHEAMKSEYLRTYFSEVCQTLLVPDQPNVVFDPFLTQAVLALLETENHPLVRKINFFHLDNDYAFRTTTVWNSLLYVNASHLHVCAQRLGVVNKRVVYNRPAQGGPFWSQIDQIMYPIDSRTDADWRLKRSAPGTFYRLVRGRAALTDFDRLVPEKDLRTVETVDAFPVGYKVPDIHRVTADEMYVFTKAFYDQDATRMSRLELMVWKLLNHEELDVIDLEDLVKGSKLWDNLERFYYVPVLMILCTVALRGPAAME